MKSAWQISKVSGSSIQYVAGRSCHASLPAWNSAVSSASFLSKKLDSAKSLFQKDLYAHYGCVNAIEFSKEGDLLISGGDDHRVFLWNITSTVYGNKRPNIMTGEHNSNIFCLAFSHTNETIYSAGNDEQVMLHDVKTGEIIDCYVHREAVYGVSSDPSCDKAFASAGEDGQVLIFDSRLPIQNRGSSLCLARYHDAFHSVQYHPTEPVYLVTANSKKGVALWDIRHPKV